MRRFILATLLATAACSQGDSPSSNASRRAAAGGSGARDAKSRYSEGAREARAVTVRYFDLIRDHEYADARLLWGNSGADSGGDALAFAALFEPYALYQPTVGEPSDIHVAGGMQYVNVTVTVRARRADRKTQVTLAGPVMLRRPAKPDSAQAGERSWRIWGTDLRIQH